MKLPVKIIGREKQTNFLLRPRDDHDKSGFVSIAGYTPLAADRLEADLRRAGAYPTLSRHPQSFFTAGAADGADTNQNGDDGFIRVIGVIRGWSGRFGLGQLHEVWR